ncbi:MAG: hypothetical protein ACXU8S_02930 [Phenylobacterium sp.]
MRSDDAEVEDRRTFTDQELTGRVLLDGGTFDHCRFHKAALIYIGGTPPNLVSCSFRDVSFEFSGAAGRTVAFLKGMAAPSSGLSSVFKATFPKLFGH